MSDINLRTTTVLGRDDKYIILPNSLLTKSQIINWTYGNIASRFFVSVGVGYTSDIALAKNCSRKLLIARKGLLNRRRPSSVLWILLIHNLLLPVYFWSEDVYGVENIKSEIRTKILIVLMSTILTFLCRSGLCILTKQIMHQKTYEGIKTVKLNSSMVPGIGIP